MGIIYIRWYTIHVVWQASNDTLMWLVWLQMLYLMVSHNHFGLHIATISGNLWNIILTATI